MKIRTLKPEEVGAAGITKKQIEASVEDVRIGDARFKTEINDAISKLRVAYEAITNLFIDMKDVFFDVNSADSEMAYHELFFQDVASMAKEVHDKVHELSENNSMRFFRTVVPRGADAIVALGKEFIVDAQLIPGIPAKEDGTKYEEFMGWLKKSQYSGIVREEVSWQSLKKVCEELAEQGLPPPPHVKLYPRPKIKIKSL